MRRLLLLLCACTVPPPDLGKDCVLVRGGPDGGATPVLKSDDVIAYQANVDVLSFGVLECDSKICVRDSLFKDPSTGPEAHGYCSAACGPCNNGLVCRPLLLDDTTLMQLKQQFDGAPTSSFCAHGDETRDASL
jgi:hypothetical protein